MPVSADRFTNEFQAAPAPDGSTIAFAARGIGDSQWWRHGHSHLDESEIWLRKEDRRPNYERIVDLNGRNVWPMWTPDGQAALFHVGPRRRAEHLVASRWAASRARSPSSPTAACSGRPSPMTASPSCSSAISRSGSSTRRAARLIQLPIKLVGQAAGPGITHSPSINSPISRCRPTARKIAVIAHGEIFAAGAREGGEAIRVTHTPGPESQVSWSPDSTRIAYLSRARCRQPRLRLRLRASTPKRS